MTIQQASRQMLNPLIAQVEAMLLVTVIGAIAGGAGFFINYFRN